MKELYGKLREEGLEILAFPCNQFGSQEPGTNEEIKKFAQEKYGAEYPLFSKIKVNGDSADPIYKFLRSKKGGLLGSSIKWNFTKFLCDKEGIPIERYGPPTEPLKIEGDIRKLL